MLKPISMPITSQVTGPVAKPFDGSNADDMGNSLEATVTHFSTHNIKGVYINTNLYYTSVSGGFTSSPFVLEGATYSISNQNFVYSSTDGNFVYTTIAFSPTVDAFGTTLASSSQATTLGLRIEINGTSADYYPGDVSGHPAWTYTSSHIGKFVFFAPATSWTQFPDWGTPAMNDQIYSATFSWLNLV